MKQLLAVMMVVLGTALGAVAAEKADYTCSMHPQISRERPGDCPICGMRLVIRKARAAVTAVPGQAAVRLPEEKRRALGVTVSRVERRPLVRTVRAPGRVAHDPDLYSALTEYRAAAEALAAATDPRSQAALTPARDAARLRLAHYGLDESQMDDLASSEHAEHLILPGAWVWIYAQIFEQDLPWVRRGQQAIITVSALPGETFDGTIRAIDPMLDAMSRTVTVRLLVRNSEARALKLEMFVSAAIESDRGRGLVVPREAILDTGARQLVYVVRGDELVPRAVKLGPRFDRYVQVLSGLMEGESVVTSANFLIDAESQIGAGQDAR